MNENQVKDKILIYCVEKNTQVSAHEIQVRNYFPIFQKMKLKMFLRK